MNNSLTAAENKNYLFERIVILIITIFSLKFYTFLVNETISKALALGGVLLTFVFLAVHIVYGKSAEYKKYFSIEIWLILFSLIISAIGALFYHEQNLSATLFAQFEFYMFVFYFLLHRFKPDPGKLMNMFIWLGYGYVAVYIIQYLAYPTELISSMILKDRGSIRINIPGSEFMLATWFILLSKFFKTRQTKFLFGLIPIIIVLVMLASRQVIASTVFITLLYIYFSKTLKSKSLVMVLLVITVIPFYFMFKDIFDQIIDISSRQKTDFTENIRYLAAKYFLFDLNNNPLWILTGNGMPASHSTYGNFLYRLSEELGYYQSDVGIIGSFSRFGILFVLAEIFILVKMTFFRYDEKFAYVRWLSVMTLMTMFTGSGLRSNTIVMICFMIYMVEYDKHTAKSDQFSVISTDREIRMKSKKSISA